MPRTPSDLKKVKRKRNCGVYSPDECMLNGSPIPGEIYLALPIKRGRERREDAYLIAEKPNLQHRNGGEFGWAVEGFEEIID
jgi:hypothetical protein